MRYKIIAKKQREEWIKILNKCRRFDFYHTWFYHSLDQSGEPLLFVYEENEKMIVFPFIRRKIEESSFEDFTSVYGYAGPISNVDFANLDQEVLQNFKIQFLAFLKNEGVISVFSRLHPMINQEILLNQFGGICDNGKTVAINLQVSIEEQRAEYRSRYRTKITQLRKQGYHLRFASSAKEIREFVAIYTANMTRVGAKMFYHFNEEYFFNFLNSNELNSCLALACIGNEIAAGALLTYSHQIVQFHLAATHENYLHDGPMKLLIDEATINGRERGMNYLHLGGGLGGKDDTLFNFKSGFSNLFLNFKTWRYIADEISYKTLVSNSNQEETSDFFPLYRNLA